MGLQFNRSSLSHLLSRLFSSTKRGEVPASGGGSTNFLRADKTWANPVGSLEALPIGSVFIAVVATNPNTLLGYGTWSAFGTGRTLVAIDGVDADFDTVEETGGSKTHTLTESEMPAHTHDIGSALDSGVGGSGGDFAGNTSSQVSASTGGDTAHNNVQPYIVVYMWKRLT